MATAKEYIRQLFDKGWTQEQICHSKVLLNHFQQDRAKLKSVIEETFEEIDHEEEQIRNPEPLKPKEKEAQQQSSSRVVTIRLPQELYTLIEREPGPLIRDAIKAKYLKS